MSKFAVQMRQISKNYQGAYANKKINFDLKQGTIHGLAGENGAGKSTLMKILFGLESPDDDGGEIFIHGEPKVFRSPQEAIHNGLGMVQQHFSLSGVITPLDNVILGAEPSKFGFINRAEIKAGLQKMAGPDLDLPWEAPTDSLSVGQHQRLEILKLLFRKSKILILDEPTGVLTPQEVQSFFNLLRRLREEGCSIIMITHKINEILSLCDDVTILKNGENAGHFHTQGLEKDTLIEAMIGKKLAPPRDKIKPVINKENPILRIQNLNVKKEGRGAIHNLSLTIHPGEILGVAGIEGNGQQALVESILGIQKYTGQIFYKNDLTNSRKDNVREKLNFGLISEDRHHQSLWLEADLVDNSLIGMTRKFSKFGIINNKKSSSFASALLTKYAVKYHSLNQKVESLSGGNQQKIVVARELTGRNPQLLLACQPTRGVDVGAIEIIHNSLLELAECGSAILLVSSELEEVTRLSDRVLVLFEGKISGVFEGPHYDFQKIGLAMTRLSSQ